EAGATGQTIEILMTPGVPMSSSIAQVLQQGLQSAGLNVRIVQADVGDVLNRVFYGTSAVFDVYINWFPGYADPTMVLPRYAPGLAGFNEHWTAPDARLSGLINQALTATSATSRADILHDTCDQIAQDANIIPLVSKNVIVGYRTDKVSAAI